MKKRAFVRNMLWHLGLLVILGLTTSDQFAQTPSRVKGDAELVRLGIRPGQSQARVKSVLAANGYEPWSCYFSDDYDGTRYAHCSAAVRHNGAVVKGIDATFKVYTLDRDSDTGEVVKVRTDQLVSVICNVLDRDSQTDRNGLKTKQEQVIGRIFEVDKDKEGSCQNPNTCLYNVVIEADNEWSPFATRDQIKGLKKGDCVRAKVLRSDSGQKLMTPEEIKAHLPRLLSIEPAECGPDPNAP